MCNLPLTMNTSTFMTALESIARAIRYSYLYMLTRSLILRKISFFLNLLILAKAAKLVRHIQKRSILKVTARLTLSLNLRRLNLILISEFLNWLVTLLETNQIQLHSPTSLLLLQLLKLSISLGPRSLILNHKLLELLAVPFRRDWIHNSSISLAARFTRKMLLMKVPLR